MRADMNIITNVAGRSLISIFCCLILGFIFYRWELFNFYYPSFGIVLFGVVGSLFFFTLRVNRRNAFALLLVLYVLDTGLILRIASLMVLVSHLIYFAAIGAALSVYFAAFSRKTNNLRSLHPLVLGTIFTFAFALATATISLVEIPLFKVSLGHILSALRINATNGFLVGLGIGLGILFIDKGYIRAAGNAISRLTDTTKGSFRDFGERL